MQTRQSIAVGLFRDCEEVGVLCELQRGVQGCSYSLFPFHKVVIA